jgi:hypothetical protein
MKDSASRDPFVHYAHLLAACKIHEPPGELIGPPLVGVGGGLRTIRDRVADGHNPAGLPGGHYVDASQPEPR